MSIELFAKLSEVFEEVFDEEVTLTSETKASDIDGWDSLHHVQLLMAIEKTFKVRFSASEIAGLKDVGHIVQLIEKKSVK